MPNKKPLSRRMCDVVQFVDEYTKKHGFSPTMVEAGAALGIHDTTARRLALEAADRGALTFTPKAHRSWRVIGDPLERMPAAPGRKRRKS
jgi:hypothetical protein